MSHCSESDPDSTNNANDAENTNPIQDVPPWLSDVITAMAYPFASGHTRC